jgi:hypothetical protein
LRKGEAAIIIKKQIAHSFTPLANLKLIEAVTIKVNLYGQGNMVIVPACKSPGLLLLPKERVSIFNQHVTGILSRDLNCKYPSWNSKVGNPNGLNCTTTLKKEAFLFPVF